jgi:hypothetical protein
MSTRQTERPLPPWVGEASVVATLAGVSVRRLSVRRMTGTTTTPIIDNMVVEIVNQVVDRVK